MKMALQNGRTVTWRRLIGLLILATVQDLRAEPNGAKNCRLPQTPLRISTWSFPPYVTVESGSVNSLSGISYEFFWSLIRKCYKNCSEELFQVNIANSEAELFNSFVNNATDIGFPLPRALKIRLGDEQVHGPVLNFRPITISQGLLFIVDVDNYRTKFLASALSSLFDDTWPMIVFILLLGGVAGIVVWVLDSSGNKDEFPRTFIKGSCEGCWWAFVSMTTVGYGDRTPKSVYGRVFGVIWILLGLVVIAMFTATATNAITASSSTGSGLQGYHVAVLNNTEARIHASRYGAKVWANYSTFDAMSKDLKNRQVDGILMDSFIASHYLNQLNDTYAFKVQEMFPRKIEYYIGWPDYDALQIDKHDQGKESCFARKLKDLETDMLEEKHLTSVKAFREATETQGILNAACPRTRNFLLILMAVLLGLIICGCIGEACYKKSRYSTRKTNKAETNEQSTGITMHNMNPKPLQVMDQKLAAMMEEIKSLREHIYKMGNGLGHRSSHSNDVTDTEITSM